MTTGLGPERQGSSPGSAEAGVADVAVAESWLVSDGRVRGLDLHWQRFERGCADARLRPSVSRAAVESALPVSGRWFPRVEVRSDGELRTTLLRPAPPREPEVTAWVFRGSDPRRAPRRKGPDLARLGALRAEAARHGAGEALLCDREGRLLEGAYTSLLWWEGDVLWAVPDDAPILDGVTRRLLLDLAAAQDVEVRYRLPTPADLDGREVWLTSALHGIRCVTSSTAPGCLRAGPAHRAPAWQARLEALAARIGESTGR
jgi:branched-subunit amino acid aminotransferase/4-amino-4-deoxychorismate lyase